MKLFEIDSNDQDSKIIDFSKYKKPKDPKQDILNIAKEMPAAFAKQAYIEEKVKEGLEKIKEDSRKRMQFLRTPTFERLYRKGLNPIEYLIHNLPLEFDVVDNVHRHRKTGKFEPSERKYIPEQILAIKTAIKYQDEIINEINKILGETKELREISKQAIASQYPNRIIHYFEHTMRRWFEIFSHVKRNQHIWKEYIKILESKL